jgi:hypothetical protein
MKIDYFFIALTTNFDLEIFIFYKKIDYNYLNPLRSKIRQCLNIIFYYT